ncbi:class I SAM-dependent methyltransferase [Paraglaciecola aquimarina]|uniref:Class I SAM-dependent methyltransferase n=1 Tax=Paraglaciecola algarum TaxID=3050085 RepID=A0ABS9D5D1_9ALTE|nr:methyltransferase domain-containing protein [Paraglaciecola sp. G1-23]MCF2948119.1 class I SAM-dependent methyltransferase [Paraglaciecola sp. G1-23]
MRGDKAIEKLLKDFSFESVVDVGCGGHFDQSKAFQTGGKTVTAVDPYDSGAEIPQEITYINKKVEDLTGKEFEYDLIWCCHCLEHQYNPIEFLTNLKNVMKPNSLVAITVPPLKHNIVNGHVTLWNGGLLLYNLVLAGFNCRNAKVKKYGYNITVIIERDDIQPDTIHIADLADWLPDGYNYQGFDGDIEELNWG